MRFTEDEDIESGLDCYNTKCDKDTDQDILLDNLQAAIDTLTDQLEDLEDKVDSADASLEGLINQNGIEITLATTTAINNVKNELHTLDSNIHSNLVTTNVTAQNLSATEANIDKLESPEATIDSLKADTVEATTLKVGSFIAKDVWTSPNKNPDPMELARIHFDKYQGDLYVYDKENRFSLTISNGKYVTYTGAIYNISITEYGVDVYLEYRPIIKTFYIGFTPSDIHFAIVYKANVEKNIFATGGSVGLSSDGSISQSALTGIDFDYDDEDPIRMDVNDSGVLEVEVDYEEEDNEDLDFSFVNTNVVLNPTRVEYEDDNNSDINFDFVK